MVLIVAVYVFINQRLGLKYLDSILMLSVWWLMWLVSTETGVSSLIFPAPEVGYHVMNYAFFMMIGGLVSKVNVFNENLIFPDISFSSFRNFSVFISLPILLITIGLALVSLKLYVFTDYTFDSMRKMFFTFNENGNLWFDSKYMWSLYLILSGVIFHYLLIVSLPVLVVKRSFVLFYMVVLLSLFDILLKASRGQIYGITVCYIYIVIMSYWIGGGKVKSKDIIFSILLFTLIATGLIFVSISRGDIELHGVLISYHTIGFSLFSTIIEMNEAYVYSPLELGRLSFGGLDYLFTIINRFLFDPDYSAPVHINTFLQNAAVVTSDTVSKDNLKLIYIGRNTFYTILSSVYLDFGTAGPILLGFVTGYFLAYFERIYFSRRNILALIILLFIFYNSLTGIFASPLEVPGFWGVFFLLIFVVKYLPVKGNKVE